MRDGAVEQEKHEMQEVKGSNPCKGGKMCLIFVRT